MAPNMSNTLLKTLEEPPLHTLIILLANNSRLILPTILSRCQTIHFNPLPIPLVSKWLVDQNGLAPDEAHLLASLSEGSPGKALELQEEIRHIQRGELLKRWLGQKTLSFNEVEQWTDLLPADREDLGSVLEVAKTLLRDLTIVKTLKDTAKLIHSDLKEEMESLAANWTLSELLTRINILHQTTQAISPFRGNANVKLALEAMMLSWAEG